MKYFPIHSDKENTYESEGGEFTMTDDKRYTIYDGKDNDWLEFASQQADFNRNAGQHMTNLRVDIAEIDDEIEDIMGISKPNDVTEIKAAADNCNEEIHMVEPVNDLVG